MPGYSVEVIAHRGACGYAPENTISSVLKAVELGSHYIEIDVHMSKDGEVVVFHDDSLNRTTDGAGDIKSKTLAEIKNLDAGKWFDKRFTNEKVPTLNEILALDFKNSNLIIEVKNVDNIYDGIESNIVQQVLASKFKNNIIYKSFSHEVLTRFHQLDELRDTLYVTIGPIFGIFVIDDWIRLGNLFDFKFVKYVQVHRFLINSKLVRKAHQKNIKIIAWDVHTPKDIQKMKDLGVDLIETDYPDRVLN